MILKDKLEYLADRIAELKAENEELARSNKFLSDQLQETKDDLEHYKEVAVVYTNAYRELTSRRASPKMYSGMGLDNIYFDELEFEKDEN